MTCRTPNEKRKRMPAAGKIGRTVRSLSALFLLVCVLAGCSVPGGQDMVDIGSWNSGKDGTSADPVPGTSDASDGASSGALPVERITPDSLTLGGKRVYFGEDVSPLLAALGQWKEMSFYEDGGDGSDSLPEALSADAPAEDLPVGDSSGDPSAEDTEQENTRKQYAYDGFYLLTYPSGGVDRLDAVILTGESAVTGEGLHVGMQENLIGEYFGAGGKAENGVYSFTGGGVRVQLAAKGGKVDLIRYEREGDSAFGSAPLILLSDVTVEIGSAIPFREYILLLDTTGEKIDLYDESRVVFDSGAADPMTEGSYPLTVRVKDSTGRTAERGFTVYVVPKTITEQTTADYVKGILEGSLAERLQSANTNEEKLRIVFQYITKESGMQYVEVSNKDNPCYVEAYNGFTTLRGDCYTYCCMSQVMLDALGIEYHVVTRSGERRSNHFWLLADFGDGWYHFDTCFHAFHWKKETFKLTDGEVEAFTQWYNTLAPGWNYYQFDKSQYPRTPVLGENGEYTYLPYTLTYTAGEGGKVIGGTDQQVLHGATGEYVTAVPDEGYVFRRWSDGVSTPMRTDSPKGDLSVAAEFVPAT